MKREQGLNPKAWESTATTRRRGGAIFCSASVSHADDDVSVSGEVYYGEKLLSNGDYYTGDWWGRLPHGHGKYLWTDACMYVGEWYKGRTMGKGKFCWASGATYEGDFFNGFMDGTGTYITPSGDTYKGSWVMNMKHGQGTKAYAKGDFYEGEWQRGSRHGRGRYQWKNGNCYIGQWKNGTIHGNGMMVWSNGSRYDGFWDDGLPRGRGTVRWGDGRCSGGFWSNDAGGDPRNVFYVAENVSVSLSEQLHLQHLKGVDEFVQPRKTSIDRHWQLKIRQVKRHGETISKGHKNYELMLNLQMGIRHSVSRPIPGSSLDPKETMQTRFPTEGSKHTPPHQSCEFRWKDYCPIVFRTLRKLFNIDAADYMISLCGDDALRELSSPGKSGSFFYLTNDDRYMIKTIKKAEAKALLRMLPAYYKHVRKYQNTLLTKFFGLHCVKLTGATQKKVRFVVMGSLFCSENTIHQCFDLKGSSHGRVAENPEIARTTGTTLKDLDLNLLFRLQKSSFLEFRRQVDLDIDFLERERIMDYSLLVGIHYRSISYEKDWILARPCSTARGFHPSDEILDPTRPLALGVDMLARAELTERPGSGELQLVGEPTGEMYDVSLSFGIIDILQDYDISKKLEHAYKSMQYDAAAISAVDPRQYSRRFRDFILKVFVEDS